MSALSHAFTLAEVLITLGIIGIVAAMTFPALIQKHNEKVTAAKLKKTYTVLSQAFISAKAEHGTPDNWNLITGYSSEGAVNLANIFEKYLKVSKNCGTEKGCLPDVIYKRLDGIDGQNFGSSSRYSKMILADGSNIFFSVRDADCMENRGSGMLKNTCAVASIDINGTKSPNQLGRDLFVYEITKEGLIPSGTSEDILYSFENTCNLSGTGFGYTAWVIYNENFDYLHCADKLGWNKAKSCKE